MATATETRPSAPPHPLRRSLTPNIRARRGRQVAVAVVGLGLTLIVLEGSWTWAIVRVLLVGAVLSRVIHATEYRSPRAAGTAVACVGLVGVAVGGAITLSYLPATGWGVRGIGGVLTAAGGLLALVLGLGLVVAATRGWKRLLLVPIVVVVCYGLGTPLAVSVYATNVGRPPLGRATPADRGVAYVDASFTTSDGVTLSGWYIPSSNGAAVVLLHGASSTRTAVLEQAVVLARNGYGVLLYDARGMGHSGGRAMNFGWYGDRDVAAALGYLETRADVDPTRLGAVGESMGGEEAIGAMATDTRLRAVVAEGATNRVAGDWSWLSEEYGVRGTIQRGVHWLTYQLSDWFSGARPPTTLRGAVAAGRRPVLLIAAGNVADEALAAQSIEAGAPDTVDIWVVAGASHTGGLRAQPSEWERRVTSFLASSLGAGDDLLGKRTS